MDQPGPFRQYTIQEAETLETALSKIEANGRRSIIVLDRRGRVTGTLSDGDIRKALINRRLGSTQVRQIMNLNFIWLPPAGVNRAPELFERYHVFLIPVLGEQNELLDVLAAY